MSTLVAEHEFAQPTGGAFLGLSLFETREGRFQAIIRTRTYDGIRVKDKWDSERIDLDARDKDAAWTEGVEKVRALRNNLEGRS